MIDLKKWFAENKFRILFGIIIAAVLTAAFFAGTKSEMSEKGVVVSSSEDYHVIVENSSKDDETHISDLSNEETSAEVSEHESKIIEISLPPESSEKDLSSLNEISLEESAPVSFTENTASFLAEDESSLEISENESSLEISENENSVETSEESLFVTPESSADKSENIPLPSEISEEMSLGQETENSSCIISIDCSTALKNDRLNSKVRSILPPDGIILAETEVSFEDGASAFEILRKICREKGIHMEFSTIPLTGGAYIEGIANLYEFDCGNLSGWMFSINGEFPSVGCSDVNVSSGDKLAFLYTCNMGDDIGNHFSGN